MSEPEKEGYDCDWQAIEQRLGFFLYQLADKSIGERVKVNPAAADSAIQYCRHRATGGRFIPERQEHFIDFIDRHCGCLSWIMFGEMTELVVAYAAGRESLPKRPYCGLLYEVDDEADCA